MWSQKVHSLARKPARRRYHILRKDLGRECCPHSPLISLGPQVVEAGTHAQLVEQGGLFAEMWRRQLEAGAVEQVGGSSSSRAASRSASAAALADSA